MSTNLGQGSTSPEAALHAMRDAKRAWYDHKQSAAPSWRTRREALRRSEIASAQGEAA